MAGPTAHKRAAETAAHWELQKVEQLDTQKAVLSAVWMVTHWAERKVLQKVAN
jgi:hypothetical protein